MNKISEYSELVQPTHINTAGTLFGGYMLAWLDLAAAKAAQEATSTSATKTTKPSTMAPF